MCSCHTTLPSLDKPVFLILDFYNENTALHELHTMPNGSLVGVTCRVGRLIISYQI